MLTEPKDYAAQLVAHAGGDKLLAVKWAMMAQTEFHGMGPEYTNAVVRYIVGLAS